jgi:glycosyltransferase involved in cell wall biosynthesis
MPYSILILTHNEAGNLPDCLASVRECDDVVVLDSGSTDETVAIAAAAGARVFQRRFDNFAAQRNYALSAIQFNHAWVFQLDADERMTPELSRECIAVATRSEHSAYFVANRLMFLGRWIRHASQFPFHQVRFLKVGEADFAGGGHGQYAGRADRGFGYLNESYVHYNFSKGIEDWVAKHNRYSSIEAGLAEGRRRPLVWRWRSLTDSYERKQWMKQMYYRMPLRPWLKFFYLLFIAGGILDGRPGWIYCRMVFFYEYLICTKVRELRLRRQNGRL